MSMAIPPEDIPSDPDDNPFWIDLAKLRNYTVHTYDESLADYVYAQLPDALRRFREALVGATETA
jgi:uncharacterized protein with HEPN domain